MYFREDAGSAHDNGQEQHDGRPFLAEKVGDCGEGHGEECMIGRKAIVGSMGEERLDVLCDKRAWVKVEFSRNTGDDEGNNTAEQNRQGEWQADASGASEPSHAHSEDNKHYYIFCAKDNDLIHMNAYYSGCRRQMHRCLCFYHCMPKKYACPKGQLCGHAFQNKLFPGAFSIGSIGVKLDKAAASPEGPSADIADAMTTDYIDKLSWLVLVSRFELEGVYPCHSFNPCRFGGLFPIGIPP